MIAREEVARRDQVDPLAGLRAQFHLPDDLVYLDGNSLGPLPVATPARVAAAVSEQWGDQLVRGWNTAGWMQLSRLVAAKIASLIGATPDHVAVADSTSVNLFKVLSAAVAIRRAGRQAAGVLLSERHNFPTDLYILQSVADATGRSVELVGRGEVGGRLADTSAPPVDVVVLTQVDYRTGAMWDLGDVTAAAHRAGALMVWDLAHSAGAVQVDLTAADADFAVGCGYKYLNGGPGAPGFLWCHPRHVASAVQPLTGWMGHAAPFDFTPEYSAAAGIDRFLCGTPPVLSMVALDAGLDAVLTATPFGGIGAIRDKSCALTQLFIELADPICRDHGLDVVTPRDPTARGSQVSLAHGEHGYAIVQALAARGVLGDFRAPDILRFGVAPLYNRFVDVWDACHHLAEVLQSGEWHDERFARRAPVT